MSELTRVSLNLEALPRNRSGSLSKIIASTGSSPRDISPTTPRHVDPVEVMARSINGRLRSSMSGNLDGVSSGENSAELTRSSSGKLPREPSGKLSIRDSNRDSSRDSLGSVTGSTTESKTFDSLRRLARTNSGLSQPSSV